MLLSDALWRRRFGAAPDVIGRAITLDNQPYTIVGVLPPRFQLLQPADVLLPIGPWAATLPDDRGWHPGIFPIARLKARHRPAARAGRARSSSPIGWRSSTRRATTASAPKSKPLHDYAVQNVRQSLLRAGGGGRLRAADRVRERREPAARARGRPAEGDRDPHRDRREPRRGSPRSSSSESVVLALAGGLAGLLLAVWAVPLLAALAGANAPGAGSDRHRSGGARLHDRACRSRTGVIFGLAPALQTTRVDVSAAINEGGRGAAAGAGHHRLRSLLVVAEWRWRRCCSSAPGC